jgi:hypothetical protein
MRTRYEEVCQLAFEKNVILMVDAEETWMQGAVDDLVNEMMEKYNKEKAIFGIPNVQNGQNRIFESRFRKSNF